MVEGRRGGGGWGKKGGEWVEGDGGRGWVKTGGEWVREDGGGVGGGRRRNTNEEADGETCITQNTEQKHHLTLEPLRQSATIKQLE